MDELDAKAREAAERMEALNPHIDQLQDSLARVEKYLADDVELAVKQSKHWVKQGMEHVVNLEQMLAMLLKTVAESQSQVASAHKTTVDLATRKANDELSTLVAVVASAAASSALLQTQIEASRQHATVLAERQDSLEQGLDRLVAASETLSSKHVHHAYHLQQASNITEDLLVTLEATASAACKVGSSVFERSVSANWWPYFLCPALSLVMGSYGLPPSILRNVGLLAAGELIGFVVSSFDQVKMVWTAYTAVQSVNGTIIDI